MEETIKPAVSHVGYSTCQIQHRIIQIDTKYHTEHPSCWQIQCLFGFFFFNWSQGKPIQMTSCSLIGWRIAPDKESSPLIGLWKEQLKLQLAVEEGEGG